MKQMIAFGAVGVAAVFLAGTAFMVLRGEDDPARAVLLDHAPELPGYLRVQVISVVIRHDQGGGK